MLKGSAPTLEELARRVAEIEASQTDFKTWLIGSGAAVVILFPILLYILEHFFQARIRARLKRMIDKALQEEVRKVIEAKSAEIDELFKANASPLQSQFMSHASKIARISALHALHKHDEVVRVLGWKENKDKQFLENAIRELPTVVQLIVIDSLARSNDSDGKPFAWTLLRDLCNSTTDPLVAEEMIQVAIAMRFQREGILLYEGMIERGLVPTRTCDLRAAVLYRYRGNHVRAIDLASPHVERDPCDFNALTALCSNLRDLGEFQEAKRRLDDPVHRLVRNEIKSPSEQWMHTFNVYMSICRDMGLPEDALDAAEYAVERTRSAVTILACLRIASATRQKYGAEHRYAETCKKINQLARHRAKEVPRNDRAIAAVEAQLLYADGKTNDAIARLQREIDSLESAGNFGSADAIALYYAICHLAILLIESGMYSEAIEKLTLATGLGNKVGGASGDTSGEADFLMAVAYTKQASENASASPDLLALAEAALGQARDREQRFLQVAEFHDLLKSQPFVKRMLAKSNGRK